MVPNKIVRPQLVFKMHHHLCIGFTSAPTVYIKGSVAGEADSLQFATNFGPLHDTVMLASAEVELRR